MPIYCFKCNCGKTFEKVLPMKDCMKPQKCDCGKVADRDLLAEHGSGNVDSQMKDYQFDGPNGTRMYAASYLPHQMSEAKRVHPGREFKLVNGAYIPVVKNRTDRKKYLREMDYIEYD